MPYPPEWRTTLKMWAAGQWIYDTVTPLNPALGYFNRSIHIEDGTGWTPGVYTIDNFIENFPVGFGDGNKNIAHIAPPPYPAADGTADGVGWMVGEYGTRHLVFDGNSLTSGDSGAEPLTPSQLDLDYPQQVIDLIGSDYWRKFNLGISAQTTTNMIDTFTDVTACYDPVKIKNILIGWEISNELYFGLTAAAAYANWVTYCELGKAAGFQVIMLSVLPRSGVGTQPDFEAKRQAANTLLRADFNVVTASPRVFGPAPGITYADLFVDVAANPLIGDAGDELDTTYYSTDQVHLIVAGCTEIAVDVNNAIGLLPLTPPVFTTQPSSDTVTEGDPVVFTSLATGSPTYQWRKDGGDLPGETGEALSIASASLGDAGDYDVVVTNSEGVTTSNTATLTVNSAGTAPTITIEPVNQSYTAGDTFRLRVVATGDPTLTYQWRKGGVNISGEVSDELLFNPADVADTGTYDVVVTNAFGSDTSVTVTVTINAVVPSSGSASANGGGGNLGSLVAAAPLTGSFPTLAFAPMSGRKPTREFAPLTGKRQTVEFVKI